MTAPYVGLRPFEYSEANLFYGRGEHIAAMVRTLRQRHFLAVVGSSGSGKSSLVRAGLLPAIDAGFMNDDAGEHDWRRVIVRPGRDPYENLLQELLPVLAQGELLAPELIEFRRQTLRGGPRGMVDVVADSLLPASTRLVVLIDQFEEIFRFLDRGRASQASEREKSTSEQRNAALAFVDLLLATAAERDPRLFVVLTMRSEYLGECEAFLGLSEAIAKSQFLTPRMKREQIQDTIERPLAAVGARIEPVVVTTLLNALGTAQDQLPRVEHILLRMWDRAKTRSPIELTMDDYRQVGEFDGALNQHADELFGELGAISTTGAGPERERVAECMFRLLADRTAQGALVRRLSSVGEVASVAGASESTVIDVVRHFLQSGCHFLVATPSPTTEKTLGAETSLDISHESLLRQWHKLSRWVRDEAELAAEIRRLKDDAWYWQAGMRGLLREPELSYLTSRRKLMPSTDWAARYIHPDELNLLDAYLAQSTQEKERQLEEEARERQRELEIERQRASEAEAAAERQRTLTQYAVFAALVAAVLVVVATWKTMSANKERNRAQVAERKAVTTQRWANKLAAESGLEAGRAHVEREYGDPAEAVLWWASALSTANDPELRASLSRLVGAWSPRERRLVYEHVNSISEFSADGRAVLTRCYDGATQVWDVATASRMILNTRSNLTVFSRDGRQVLTVDDDNVVQLWSSETGTRLRTLPEIQIVRAAAFSPDRRSVITAGDEAARIWNTETGQLLKELLHDSQVNVVAISSDANMILTGHADITARLWDVHTGDRLCELPHEAGVVGAVFSQDGLSVLTWCDNGDATLWDSQTGVQRLPSQKHETRFAPWCSSDGRTYKTMVWCDDRNPRVLSVRDARTGKTLDIGSDGRYVYCAAFSPDGQAIAIGVATTDFSIKNVAHVQLWSANTERPTAVPRPLSRPLRHSLDIHHVAFNYDGTMLQTRGSDNHMALWDVRNDINVSFRQLQHEDWTADVAFSPDGQTLLTGGSNGALARLWDVRSYRLLRELDVGGGASVAFSPDGRTVVTKGWRTTLWDARTGSRQSEIPCEGDSHGVAFSPDGETLLMGGKDSAILWSLRTRSSQLTLPHGGRVLSVAYSHDGTRILTGGSGKACLWDAKTGKMLKELPSKGEVNAVAFSPDGESLLTGGGTSDQGYVLIWNAEGTLTGELPGHDIAVQDVAFSPDGRSVLTCDFSSTRLLDLRSKILLEELHVDGMGLAVAFSPNGQWIAIAGTDKTRLAPVSPPAIADRQHPERLRMSVEVRTGKRLDENGVVKRLTFDEWNERRRKLDEMGGPCDRPTWDEYNAWQRTQPLGAAGPRL